MQQLKYKLPCYMYIVQPVLTVFQEEQNPIKKCKKISLR